MSASSPFAHANHHRQHRLRCVQAYGRFVPGTRLLKLPEFVRSLAPFRRNGTVIYSGICACCVMLFRCDSSIRLMFLARIVGWAPLICQRAILELILGGVVSGTRNVRGRVVSLLIRCVLSPHCYKFTILNVVFFFVFRRIFAFFL